ncbi:MAG: hypothetical protein FIA99_02270 [Ruminiclostridium sp.]|nr:hypothetical protein [Ruminiclostridium sp.]
MARANINMISGSPCTGCSICSTVCSRSAINVELNAKGFLEAKADENLCTDCGKCVKICVKYKSPGEIAYTELIKEKGRVYMACSMNDSARYKSSSGGIGYEISKRCVSLGYSVFGACYDFQNNRVEHRLADTQEGILEFAGSKYLQSFTGKAFSGMKRDRKYVVFAAPCQTYALRQKIRQENIEENVLLVDFFCHGVPSYLLWNSYLKYVRKRYKTGNIKAVAFRDKKHGWHDYSMVIEGDSGCYTGRMRKDLFYHFYLSNVCLDDACYKCGFRLDNVYSDIRLGDFWGSKYADDEKGVSLVTANTGKGVELLKSLADDIILEEAEASDLLAAQPIRDIAVPEKRKAVMDMLQSGSSLRAVYWKYLAAGHFRSRLIYFIKGLLPGNMRTAAKKMIKYRGKELDT